MGQRDNCSPRDRAEFPAKPVHIRVLTCTQKSPLCSCQRREDVGFTGEPQSSWEVAACAVFVEVKHPQHKIISVCLVFPSPALNYK